jgi:TRAP transporter 4TM/12TM fusion protein
MGERRRNVHLKTPLDSSNIEVRTVVFGVLAAIWCLFHVYTSFVGAYRPIVQRSVFVFFGLALCFLVFPTVKDKFSKWFRIGVLVDLLLITTTFIVCGYALINEERFLLSVGELPSKLDLLVSGIAVLILLEAARRSIGNILAIVVMFGFFYGYFGPYLPGSFRHVSISWMRMIDMSYRTDLGMWGGVTGVGATIIAPFIILGAMLVLTGAGDTFRDLAIRFVGRLRGGGAMVAVLISSLFGMVSGSAAANAATTGVFTIPMMTRIGYRPAFAGAVEATASSGGQLVPPIMGAAAFLMAEILGVPYLMICVAAIIPAVLYYFSLFLGVWLESKKSDLKPVPKELIPSWKSCLSPKKTVPLFVPIGILLYLIIKGWSLPISCFWSMAALIILYVGASFRNIRKVGAELWDGAISAGRSLIVIAILCSVANIFIGLINQTGLGVRLSEVVVNLSHGVLFWAYFFSMIVCIILGMGIPTVGAYAVGAAVLGSTLLNLGVPPLSGHLFIFYFALISAITPPVCAAVFVTAGIAGSPWLTTAGIAMRLGLAAFVIPFAFLYNPDLLIGVGHGGLALTLLVCLKIVGAIIMLSSCGMGYLLKRVIWWQRILLFVGGILLIASDNSLNLVGLGIGLAVMTAQIVLKEGGGGVNMVERVEES